MNAWFDRLRTAALADLGDDPALREALTLSSDEARTLLDVARDAAHGSGARQFAPLATYLVGRAVQARGGDRAAVMAAIARAVQMAGPSDEGAAL